MERRQTSTMFNKNRLEALSDGVFAIAMTLLVLELKVPQNAAPSHLADALASQSHAWISFAVTFFIASVFWTFQHRVFDLVEKTTRAVLIPTFFFLGFVSVLPFSTSLWGHYIEEPQAICLYFGNQFAIAFTLIVKLEIAKKDRNLRLGGPANLLRFRLYQMACIMLLCSIAPFFVPIERIWPIPLVLGIVARLIRRGMKQHLLPAG